MPGVLWKKFDSKTIASNLAFIGSIKDDILDVEELAMNLLDEVRRNYPDLVAQRYKLDAETLALPPYELTGGHRPQARAAGARRRGEYRALRHHAGGRVPRLQVGSHLVGTPAAAG